MRVGIPHGRIVLDQKNDVIALRREMGNDCSPSRFDTALWLLAPRPAGSDSVKTDPLPTSDLTSRWKIQKTYDVPNDIETKTIAITLGWWVATLHLIELIEASHWS